MNAPTRAALAAFVVPAFLSASDHGFPRESRSPVPPGFAGASATTAAPAGDWRQAVIGQLEQHEYELSRTGLGLQAPNRAQNFRTYFKAGGIQVIPREKDGPRWSWAWSTKRWGRTGAWREFSLREPENLASRATYESPGITEWYVNGKDGLEHGYTVHTRPIGDGPLRIEGVVRGDLRAVLDAAGDAVDFIDADGVRLLRYGGLAVWDDQGRSLPATMEVSGTQLALVVDDNGARYPVTVDPTLTTPDWNTEGNLINATLGYAVSTAGDVNGDGFSDALVSAPFYDNGQTSEGRVFVYEGSANGLPASPSWSHEVDQEWAQFGYSAGTAGDVNGDGYDDIIVGAPFNYYGQLAEGVARVFHGSASGLDSLAAWTYESNQAGAWFGNAVAAAGDVNGDGYDDVVVGAWYWDDGQTNEGAAFVFHGSPSGLGTSPAWFAAADQDGAEFGTSVFTAGDVNGDGYSDVIVGAPLHDATRTDQGRAYVYQGSASGLGASPSWTTDGLRTDGHLGQSVSTAGDMNGDGYSDVIVGGPGEYGVSLTKGQAYVFHGSASGLGTTAAWTRTGLSLDGETGAAVGVGGDVNGDGYADVLIGSPGYSSGQGRVDIALGSETPPYGGPSIVIYPGGRTGSAVGTAGDVNGDGFSDILVGSPEYSNAQSQEGRVDLFLGCGLEPTATEVWTLEKNQAYAQLGASVAGAGDVNGDGYDDVIIGAYGYDAGESAEGAAFVFHGSENGPGLLEDWSAEGNQTGAFFGHPVAGAGDVNGDGYEDVIVGATGYDSGEINEGAAFVYLGSPSGLAASPAWIGEGNQQSADYGVSVAGAGDVNGDGFSDVVVGALNYSDPETSEGRADIFLGSPSGPMPTPAWTATGNQAGAEYGNAVAGAGDVNGDGFSDVVVGARKFSAGQDEEGAAFLYLGSPGGLGATPTWTFEGNQASAYLGDAVAGAGDVNGDGYSDLLVGAYAFDSGDPNDGKAFLFLGSSTGPGSIPDWTRDGDQANAYFSDALASAGDVNGDGYDDLIIGAPYYTAVQAGEGVAHVYLGSPTGPSGIFDWKVEGDQDAALLGFSVASAGDVNGDGFSDVLVGAPLYDDGQSDEGAVYLYFGNDGDGAHRGVQQRRSDGSAPIALLGRSDAPDAFLLTVRGRSAEGRAPVQLEAEVKPAGVPFDGAGLITGPVTDSGPSGANLDQLITGLTPDTPYRWRLRVVSDSPFFPRSPWSSPQEAGTASYSLRTAPPVTGVEDRDAAGAAHMAVAAAPNPFRTSTRVSFTLETAARVRLAVYDIAGREIAVLDEGRRAAGPHTVRWIGTDRAGRKVASGVYFAKLVAERRTVTRKLVLAP